MWLKLAFSDLVIAMIACIFIERLCEWSFFYQVWRQRFSSEYKQTSRLYNLPVKREKWLKKIQFLNCIFANHEIFSVFSPWQGCTDWKPVHQFVVFDKNFHIQSFLYQGPVKNSLKLQILTVIQSVCSPEGKPQTNLIIFQTIITHWRIDLCVLGWWHMTQFFSQC